MKSIAVLAVAFWALAAPLAWAGKHARRGMLASPLLKVVTLVEQLEKQVAADDLKYQKVYNDYVKLCSTVADRRQREAKECSATREALKAAVMKGDSDATESNAQIAELSEVLTAGEAELEMAASAREGEGADFEAANKELLETLETLERAMTVLQKELGVAGASGSANFLQQPTPGLRLFEAAIQEVVDSASAVASEEELTRLDTMVQGSSQTDGGRQAAASVPGTAAPVMQALQDLKERASGAQAELSKKEGAAQHNFELLKASLTVRMQSTRQEVEEAKKALAQAQQEAALAGERLRKADQEIALIFWIMHRIGFEHQYSREQTPMMTQGRQTNPDGFFTAEWVIGRKDGFCSVNEKVKEQLEVALERAREKGWKPEDDWMKSEAAAAAYVAFFDMDDRRTLAEMGITPTG